MNELTPILASAVIFSILALIVRALVKEALTNEDTEPFGVSTHDPEPPVECLSDSFRVPAFIRHQEEELPLPRKERE
jgi:hypothetical protein